MYRRIERHLFLFILVVSWSTNERVVHAVDSVDPANHHEPNRDERIAFKPNLLPTQVVDWTVQDVAHWCRHVLHYEYFAKTLRDNHIDGLTLLALEEKDLLGLTQHPLHHRKIWSHIQRLKGESPSHCAAWSLHRETHDVWYYFLPHTIHQGNRWSALFASIFTPRLLWLWSGSPNALLREVMYVPRQDALVGRLHDSEVARAETERDDTSWFEWLVTSFLMIVSPHIVCAWTVFRTPWFRANWCIVVLYGSFQIMNQLQEYALLQSVRHRHRSILEVLGYQAIGFGCILVVRVISYVLPYHMQAFGLYLYITFVLGSLGITLHSLLVADIWTRLVKVYKSFTKSPQSEGEH